MRAAMGCVGATTAAVGCAALPGAEAGCAAPLTKPLPDDDTDTLQEYVSLRSLEPKPLRMMKMVMMMMIICVSHVTSARLGHMLPRGARVTCYPGERV